MTFFYKHIVPTGLRMVLMTFFYKHIVPTGLKKVQRIRNTPNPPANVIYYLTISYLAQFVILIKYITY